VVYSFGFCDAVGMNTVASVKNRIVIALEITINITG
jgi:hypothetical protein